jgi:hypothetical protein
MRVRSFSQAVCGHCSGYQATPRRVVGTSATFFVPDRAAVAWSGEAAPAARAIDRRSGIREERDG